MSFAEIINDFTNFSLKCFSQATYTSSLEKLEKEELKELKQAIKIYTNKESDSLENVAEEYIDCIICLVDSAVRLGINPEYLETMFIRKTIINKQRNWSKNNDNTYSSIK